jgi:nucleoredoxin
LQAIAAIDKKESERLAGIKSSSAMLQHLTTHKRAWLQRGADDTRTEEEVEYVAEDNDIVGVFFSASWCGPSHEFTPLLKKAYEEYRAESKGFEVVFVSLDENVEQFNTYFAEMPWLALPYATTEEEVTLRADIMKLYAVKYIPKLVMINAQSGEVITEDGVAAIRYKAKGQVSLCSSDPVLIPHRLYACIMCIYCEYILDAYAGNFTRRG